MSWGVASCMYGQLLQSDCNARWVPYRNLNYMVENFVMVLSSFNIQTRVKSFANHPSINWLCMSVYPTRDRKLHELNFSGNHADSKYQHV